jgi:cation transport regulator ChaB
MKYTSIRELPVTVRTVLPEEAQALYLKAYTEGWDTYDEETSSELSRESVAHRQGWVAVEREFVQEERSGKWYRRGEEPEVSEPASLVDKVKAVFTPSSAQT